MMRLAGESACPTTGKLFACIGGTGSSLSTPACGRIFFSPSDARGSDRSPDWAPGGVAAVILLTKQEHGLRWHAACGCLNRNCAGGYRGGQLDGHLVQPRATGREN